MKKLKISVNNKKLEIHFDYDNENNELLTEVFDAKGNRLDGHKTNVIMKELIKGFRVEEECLALKVLRKKDSPIVLYTDDEGNINPALFYERNDFMDGYCTNRHKGIISSIWWSFIKRRIIKNYIKKDLRNWGLFLLA